MKVLISKQIINDAIFDAFMVVSFKSLKDSDLKVYEV